MPRPITLPKAGQPKQFPLLIPSALARDLYVYCSVTGAQHTKVICKAVRLLIDRELERNRGIAEDCEEFERRLADEERTVRRPDAFRVVEGTKKRKERRSPLHPKGTGNREDR